MSGSLLSYNKTSTVTRNESQALVTKKTEVEAKADCQDLRMTDPEEGRNQEAKTTLVITATNKVT